MSNLYAPFRYDYVGSFLRPAELKKARADYEAGAITADQLKAVEEYKGVQDAIRPSVLLIYMIVILRR